MNSKAHQNSQHVLALDGVRGLAILSVLAFHLLNANSSTGNRILDVFQRMLGGAWVGVDLFFVLSGFLITGILFDSLGDQGYFSKFYARRGLRILPLYYGFLLVLIALTGPLHLNWEPHMRPSLLLYLQNSRIFQPLFAYDVGPQFHLSHLWSLAVEEQFYLVWPLVIFYVRALRRLLLIAICGSAFALLLRIYLAWHGTDPAVLYQFTICRADSLLLGGGLALVLRSHWREWMLARANYLMAFSAVGLAAIIFHDRQFDWRYNSLVPTVGLSLLALFSVGLIANTFRAKSVLRPLLESSWLRFLGKYSYGIYVLHFPLHFWLTLELRAQLLSATHSKLVSVLGTGVLVCILSIGGAYLSFNLYERHFLRLKKYFEYRPS